MFNDKTKLFCKKFDVRLPIIQAPMAGGIVTPALIKEVAQHGGLGSLPLGYLSLEQAKQLIDQTKALTSQAFAVNLFIPGASSKHSKKQFKKMLAYLNQQALLLGLDPQFEVPTESDTDLKKLIGLILDEGISLISLTFGLLNKKTMDLLLNNQVRVIGTATTVQEGLALEALGCQAVVAQGFEAGGHRGGGFLENPSGGFIGTLALVPQMVDALSIPVIASGGIMDGRGLAAALTLGASAVQMGTAFLTCTESKASTLHQDLILNSPAEATCITSVFTGKPVRSFKNKFVIETEQHFNGQEIPAYPIQHQLTKALRAKANQLGCEDYAGLWAGQGAPLNRSGSVAALLAALEQETFFALSQF